MKKTVVAIILAIITAVGVFSFSAGASSIGWKHTSAMVGECFVLTLSGKNIRGLESTDLVMEYDPEALEFVTSADLIEDIVMTSGSPRKGKVTVSIAYPYSATGDADMAAITFKALKTGRTTLKITISEWLGTSLPENLTYDIIVGRVPTTTMPATTTEPETTTVPVTTTEPETTTEPVTTTEPETTTEPTTEAMTEIESITDIEEISSDEPKSEIPSSTEPTTESYVLGDVNGDREVTAADARIALRLAIKLERPEDYKNAAAADADGDGKITAVDARKILRAAIKLEKLQ